MEILLVGTDDEIAFEWISKYWYYRNLRIARNIKNQFFLNQNGLLFYTVADIPIYLNKC